MLRCGTAEFLPVLPCEIEFAVLGETNGKQNFINIEFSNRKTFTFDNLPHIGQPDQSLVIWPKWTATFRRVQDAGKRPHNCIDASA